MQGTGWIELFRRIPSNLHDTLALGLTTCMEIVVQQILRLDDTFMVLRGRLSGTNDGARIVILPYAQLVSVAFNRRMAATEVEAIFGKSQFAPAGSPGDGERELAAAVGDREARAPTGLSAAGLSAPGLSAPGLAPVGQPAKPENKPGQISKSILLARLRERLAAKTK